MKKIYLFFLLCSCVGVFAQAPIMNPILGATVICSSPSSPTTFSTSASNSPTSYSWTVIPSASVTIFNSASAITNISFPYSNGTYTIYCYANNGFGSSPTESFVVTVFETPTVTFSGANTFCQGSSTNLSASSTILAASPTIFYNWSPGTGLNTTVGPNVIANPPTITVYTVTITIGPCSNTGQITITPLNSPTVTANMGYTTVCAGTPITLFGIGANSYTWTNGVTNNIPFSPNISNGYIVTGSIANGCTDTAFVQVTVDPLPSFTAASSSSVLCIGQTASITINGTGNSYSLNANPISVPFIISPTVTTTYTIHASTSAGCTSSQIFTQVVSSCNGIKENEREKNSLNAYPNPNNGSFNLRSDNIQHVSITNSLGQIIRTIDLTNGEATISDLGSGIYILEAGSARIKIVVNN